MLQKIAKTRIKNVTFSALFLALLLSGTTLAQQVERTKTNEKKSSLSVNLLRFSTVTSISYRYRLWENKKQNFRTGFQVGIGYGNYIDSFKGWSIPIGIYGEYGKKHRIGFDANIVYKFGLNTVLGYYPNPNHADLVELQVYSDYGAFNGSIYYSYNFGKNMRYNTGIGLNVNSYFGSNYGSPVQHPIEFKPFIFFGVRF